ncbi:hypothetical protein JCM14076_11400 [Methylosoma difficile]
MPINGKTVLAAPPKTPETFPAAMTFRAFDNTKYGSIAFEQRLENQAPFSFIHAPGNEKKAKAVHDRWPDKIVTVQDAYGGINEHDFSEVWPGHLLYKQGTLLSQNISPEDTVFTVTAPNLIANNQQIIKRTNKSFPYALVIYALNPSGKPDWSKAEHVALTGMDGNKIRVERGQWNSRRLAFKAGQTVVAAHMMFWTQQWQLNFSLHCPRGGPQNLTAAEWFAQKAAQKVINSKADGVEFDVARWTWGFPLANPMDVNNDLIADYGYIDGVNSFGLGGQVFFRELRKQLGTEKIIQADSNDAQTGMRGWQFLNGVQMESFPAANDFNRFSQAFGHLRLWVENAGMAPHLSYPFTKTPTTLFANDHTGNSGNADYRFRIGLASACLLGMPHPFANLKDIGFDPANAKHGGGRNEEFGVFKWDEYHGGNLQNWHWLGRPIENEQQHLSDLDKTDLLSEQDWQWSNQEGFKAEFSQNKTLHSAKVTYIPDNILPEKRFFGTLLSTQNGVKNLTPGQEYTLEFDARGDDTWQYAGQVFEKVPRMLTISGAEPSGKNQHPLSVLVDSRPRHYRVSFVADGSPAAKFGISEQIGSTEISNIKLYKGSAERWSREFENGMVLLNMTKNPWIFKLKKDTFQHLKGDQNININNGKPIEDEVIVPAQDAVFLAKH